jgi:alpha-beta hydrolase superfamily lysophospholipase
MPPRSLWLSLPFLGLVGCATTTCLEVATGTTPARTTTATSGDGTCLARFSWAPVGQPVRGIVVLVHGLRDYSLRMEELAAALTSKGFAVVAQDHRGHGYSGGARQRFDSIEQLEADVDLAVADARTQYPGVPVFVFGHSMGGLVAARYALDHQAQLAGVVVSGGALAFDDKVTDGQKSAARFFGAVLPGLPAQDLDDDAFVTSAQTRAAFMADPHITHEKLPARSARALVDGIEALADRRAELTLPVLFIHGGNDTITPIAGSEAFVKLAKSADKTFTLYPGQRHDLAHEADHAKVVADVAGWVEKHVPTPTP